MATRDIQIITASQIITFDDDSDADRGVLKLEVDRRNDGLNAGKTSFQPGDSVGLLLYKSPNVRILEGPIITAGVLDTLADETTEHSGFLSFAGNNDATMSYPICSAALSWVGSSDLGSYRVENCSRIVLTDPPDWNPGAGDTKVGILRYSGNATATGYRLRNTFLPDESPPYQIGIYVFGVAE